MYKDGKIIFGTSDSGGEIGLVLKRANRHGLIAGATGTGKTTTLKTLAENFSDAGVPVFFADVKGDLAPVAKQYPVNFWDIYGEKGMPLRTTISEMGPLLLARLMNLSDVQADLLSVAFKIADSNGLLLLDTKDLKAILNYMGDNAKELSQTYGNITKQSLGVIIRNIVALETEGADQFFGETALNVSDWLIPSPEGKGTIQILDCQKLINSPDMYATFLLWMMSELFETLPEVGDLDRPKIVFFFDEAHMLFDNASKTLQAKIEQVIKLIRSKGVGIYFITQSPKDIPDEVLAQLGNKIQHALHAYTPAEQKAVKVAAQSYRANPAFDTYETIQALGIGQALVSILDENGVPTIVEKTQVMLPNSQGETLSDDERDRFIKGSQYYSKYIEYFDRESAYEILENAVAAATAQAEKDAAAAEAEKQAAKEQAAAEKQAAKEAAAAEKEKEKQKKATTRAVKSVAKSATGTIGRELGNTIGNSIGGSLGKKIGGNVGASLGRGILDTLFKS